MSVMLCAWINKESPFPCPVLAQDELLRHLGILLSAAKRPANPYNAKLLKITARLQLWDKMCLSLFARANVAATLIASCARCHASCAVVSEEAIKQLHTMLPTLFGLAKRTGSAFVLPLLIPPAFHAASAVWDCQTFMPSRTPTVSASGHRQCAPSKTGRGRFVTTLWQHIALVGCRTCCKDWTNTCRCLATRWSGVHHHPADSLGLPFSQV